MRIGDYMILGSWEQAKLPPGSVQKGDMEILKERKLVSIELYNLKNDIGQKENLAEKEPQRLAEMREKLVKVYSDIQSQMPEWDLPSAPRSVEKKKEAP